MLQLTEAYFSPVLFFFSFGKPQFTVKIICAFFFIVLLLKQKASLFQVVPTMDGIF